MINGQALIEFGTGTVAMSTMIVDRKDDPDKKPLGLFTLQECEPQEIGSYRKISKEEFFDVDDNPIHMIFKNIESVDAVIESLTTLRKKMKEVEEEGLENVATDSNITENEKGEV